MKKIILLSICFAFAYADGGVKNYDIVERSIYFVIFVGILYYFLANPIKNAYKARIEAIASRLQKIEDKLKDSKLQKDMAIKKVEETKLNTQNYIQTAKTEAKIVCERLEEETKHEILNLQKSSNEQKEFEKRKMVKSTVNEILNEIFDENSVKFDQSELVNLVIKKVG